MTTIIKIFSSILFIGMLPVGFTSCNVSNSQSLPYSKLLERKDTIGKSTEWLDIQKQFKEYAVSIDKNADDYTAFLHMAELYINEARIGENQQYYYKAAMQIINTLLEKENVSVDTRFLVLTYKSSILLSLHQFEEAQKTAELAVNLNPYNANIYGALIDAHVELGQYSKAVEMCDKMISIRPDLRSYSRVSYIRQIHGDNDGAKTAMKMAIDAGPTGYENTEWARVQLADLYLNTGKLDTAKYLYESALVFRPNYAYAEIGLAKLARAQKQYDTAIFHCKRAIEQLSESAFVSLLGELYELKGDAAKADQIHREVLALLLEAEQENEKERIIKHNGNRELSFAFLNTKNLKEALKYAEIDLQIRPKNIDANELVAWIYYLQNDVKNAKTYIDAALSTQVKSSTTLYKAALIYEANADISTATLMKTAALKINNMIDPYLAKYEQKMQIAVQ